MQVESIGKKTAFIITIVGAAFAAGLTAVRAQQTGAAAETDGAAISAELAAQLAAIEQQPTIEPSTLPEGGFAVYYSAQHPSWPPLPCNFYNVPLWSLGGNFYLLDDLAISYPTNSVETANRMTAMDGTAQPMDGGLSPAYQTQSGIPYLSIEQAGTNAVLVTVWNNVGPTNYEILTTPVLINPSWTLATNGLPGQTNFVLNLGEYYTGFYRAVMDTNNVPWWQAADPNNPGAGVLAVFIDSPTNGAVIQ